MSKIYQKMYLKGKNPAEGVLSGFIDNVILRGFYSESRPLSIKRAGFTLIEMLVVVLIIGILAAVALPSYQKAVWRSRNAQLKSVIRPVIQAQKLYRMANGEYAASFSDLDIDFAMSAPASGPGWHDQYCQLETAGSDAIRRGDDWQIILNQTREKTGAVAAVWISGKYRCSGFAWSPSKEDTLICIEARNNSYWAEEGEFCVNVEGGKKSAVSLGSWARYTL